MNMTIKMLRPRIMKSYGKNKNDEHFFRYELEGYGLVKTANVCFTWAKNIQALKIKVQHRIEQFKERQMQVLHAKFKNGIKS